MSPVTLSPVDARLAELQHYTQRETDALVLAKDVVRQLQAITELDQKALAEVNTHFGLVFFLSFEFYFMYCGTESCKTKSTIRIQKFYFTVRFVVHNAKTFILKGKP